MIIWDNLNIAFRVGEQRKGSKDHFDNGTTATLIPLYEFGLPLDLKPPRDNRRPVIGIIMYSSFLVFWLHLCVTVRCDEGVLCSTYTVQPGRIMSQCGACYHNRECRSFKVTVFVPSQVLPDVIVSNTPHAVVVYYYHNGWSRNYENSSRLGTASQSGI